MSSRGREKYFSNMLIYILDNAARRAYSRRRSSADVPDGAAPANYWDETDALAEHYTYNGDGELAGVRYMVQMSPVMIWLDTQTGDVEARDGGYHARYPMGQTAVDWLNEWAEVFGPMSR